ncbi:MAG: DNA (cytosine-5-)-methyltransferase [Bacteroidetes bacterium]|nr:MAG: DNA (cytosine-5-)-methyltransferase [Bacteroidota bacterium]
MKHLGLFEGIGGFSLAARWMGWQTIAYSEIDPFCLKVLSYHFPDAVSIGDITQADFTPYANTIDIITGGFPCQPYSVAGRRAGKNDPRHLWPQMFRAIREVKPKWVVGENVRGLLNWSKGLVHKEICTQLENEGYEVQSYLLPASAVGAPHERYRLFIVANYNGIGRESRPPDTHGRQKQVEKRESLWYKVNSIIEGGTAPNTKSRGLPNGDAKQAQNPAHASTQRHCFVPDWENFPTQPPVFSRNDGFSGRLDGITVPSWRRESVKAYGNAIVPQLAYQIFKSIEDYSKTA